MGYHLSRLGLIQRSYLFSCYDGIVATLAKIILVILQDAFFVVHALYNDRIIEGECSVNRVWFLIAKEEGNL